MKILSLYETSARAEGFIFFDIDYGNGLSMPNDNNVVYTAFFESPDDGYGTVLEATLIVSGTSHMYMEIESVPHFDSYHEAHKYAFIRSFGEEAYEASPYPKRAKLEKN